MAQLISLTDKGLYCSQGNFYIDPWRAVDYALITHAHGDHARWGSKHYLSHTDSVPILKLRLGKGHFEGMPYGEVRYINGVEVSFHPAGHIIGSTQIRVAYQGEVWVVSGDYKTEYDGISTAFEPVRCHTFITECTFGLPVYKWPKQQEIFDDINAWWRQNKEKGMATVLMGYALGKAQRILHNVDHSIGPIYVHGSIYNLNKVMAEAGLPVKEYPKIDPQTKKGAFKDALIVTPSSAIGTGWLRRFLPYSLGNASGWMAIRGIKRRQAVDKGFVLSDHADWDGLNAAIDATGAECVLATHGYTTSFAAWLRERGYDARVLETKFEGEVDEATDAETAEPQNEGGEE